jgi:hypothetical protein
MQTASQQEVALTDWAIQTACLQHLRPFANRKTTFDYERSAEGSWVVPETVAFRELKEQESR